MAKELVIKINGDISNYAEALNMAEEETEALGDGLNKVAVASGVALAALTAEVYLSVKAFNVEAQALAEVNDALQNQGIYTTDLARAYRDVAEEIEKKTGIDSDQISMAQASTQALIGQTVITDDLTRAVVDFAAKQKIDVATAFNTVGKAIQGNVGALGRYGLEIDGNATKQERLQQITDQLTQKYQGSAEAAAKASGSTVLLEAAFGNLQKQIGSRFAPVFDKAVGAITNLINTVQESKALTDFVVSMIAAGVAVSGTTLVVSLAGIAYLKLRAALLAAQIATNAMTIATRALVGATGLGLLVLLLTEIYLNWNTIWPRMQAVFNAFANNIIAVAKGVGEILYAVFVPSADSLQRIQAGAKQVADAVSKGYAEATADLPKLETPGVTQDPSKKAAADAAAKKEAEEEARKLATKQANLELLRLEEEKASLDMIDLKKQEIELLKALEEEKDANMREIQTRRLEENRARQEEQEAIDRERRQVIRDELLAENEAFQQMSEEQQQAFLDRNIQKLEQDMITRRTVKDKAAQDELKQQIEANNKFLLEQQRYGTAYATINKAMHSAVFQGSKTAFGELSALQESSNNTLKSIGKTAAVANIIIKTAESAMNIYAGFSTIPIIGPALGVAGAAAAIAFGAEQVGKVRGAAKGGLATGGIKGVDSIPFMLQDQELVAPAKNFEEVIGSVRASREAEKFLPESSGSGAGDPRMLTLLESIDSKLSQPTQVFQIQGDVLSEDSFMQTLAQKLSDGIQFGNLKVFGVNGFNGVTS